MGFSFLTFVCYVLRGFHFLWQLWLSFSATISANLVFPDKLIGNDWPAVGNCLKIPSPWESCLNSTSTYFTLSSQYKTGPGNVREDLLHYLRCLSAACKTFFSFSPPSRRHPVTLVTPISPIRHQPGRLLHPRHPLTPITITFVTPVIPSSPFPVLFNISGSRFNLADLFRTISFVIKNKLA